MRSLTLNVDFDLTLANLNNIYEEAINDIFNIEVDLSEGCEGPLEILGKTFKGCFKKALLESDTNPLKKLLFEFEKVKKEFENYVVSHQENIEWNKRLIKIIDNLRGDIIGEVNLISNNSTELLKRLTVIKELNFDQILGTPYIRKPSGSWINLIKNKDPKTNIILGDSIFDMISGIKAGLPKANRFGYIGFKNNKKLKLFASQLIENPKELKNILEKREEIINDFKIVPLI